MARPKKNKTRMQIKIDTELKALLDKKNIDKSAYINQILYKELLTENSNLPSQNPTHKCPSRKIRDVLLLKVLLHEVSKNTDTREIETECSFVWKKKMCKICYEEKNRG